jgi:hypothetical protein
MTRTACRLAAFAAALLVVVPACDKKKPTEAASGGDSPRPGSSDARPDTPSRSGGRSLIAQSSPRAAVAREQSQMNLKQIGMALHNHHDAVMYFPAGVADPAGKKVLLSWRVAILPYIEQDNLYKQFKMDEPWDSPANKKLIGLMPKVFAAPTTEASDGKTYYRGFTGPRTVLNPQFRPNVPIARGMTITQITDGSSNTLVVAEAADPVVWTKPDELEYDPKKPVPKLGGVFEAGFHGLFADGSVKFLPKSTDEQTVRNLIDAGDGNVVNLP